MEMAQHGFDTMAFSAGIGENPDEMRLGVVKELEWMWASRLMRRRTKFARRNPWHLCSRFKGTRPVKLPTRSMIALDVQELLGKCLLTIRGFINSASVRSLWRYIVLTSVLRTLYFGNKLEFHVKKSLLFCTAICVQINKSFELAVRSIMQSKGLVSRSLSFCSYVCAHCICCAHCIQHKGISCWVHTNYFKC